MTLARLAWLEAGSTLAIVGATAAFTLPPAAAPLSTLAPRILVIASICVAALYFNDLYNFELPHDFPHLSAGSAERWGGARCYWP